MISAHPGRHRALPLRLALAAGVALTLALALAPAAWAGSSLRAAAATCALGGAVLLARTGAARSASGRRLVVVARQALSRDAGVALLELDGRPVLIGFGASGVRVLEPVTAPARPPRSPPKDLP